MNNLIIYGLFIAIPIAMIHFFYESVVLPSIRMTLRYKFFALRDRLRLLKIENPEIDYRLFKMVDDHINTSIAFSPKYTIGEIFRYIRVYNSDKKLAKEIDKRVNYVHSSGNKVIIEISKKTSRNLTDTLIANSGMWFFYLAPIIGVVIIILLFIVLYEVILRHRIEGLAQYIRKSRLAIEIKRASTNLSFTKRWISSSDDFDLAI